MFRAALTALPLAVCAGTALAQGCGHWVAEVWDVEGGRALTAHVCAETGGERSAMLAVQCWGRGEYALLFDDGSDGQPPGGDLDYAPHVLFASEDGSVAQPMTYQSMRGDLYAAVPANGPLLRLFSEGRALTVTPEPGGYLPRGFSLSGSTRALARLAAGCR